MGHKLDITGERFGKLTAIKSLGWDKSRKATIWECSCECGKLHRAVIAGLRKGRVKSCGCATILKRRHKHIAINQIVRQYFGNARKRNIKFNLTMEEFEKLIDQECFYCGSLPSSIKLYYTYSYKYNGIDRIDNNQGYTTENCVTCCKICNKMKMDMGVADFLSHIEKVFINRGVKWQQT